MAYVEDLKLGANKDIGPKGIFEMASGYKSDVLSSGHRKLDLLRHIDLSSDWHHVGGHLRHC